MAQRVDEHDGDSEAWPLKFADCSSEVGPRSEITDAAGQHVRHSPNMSLSTSKLPIHPPRLHITNVFATSGFENLPLSHLFSVYI